MVVSDKLKKHIVVEIFALLFLIAVIIYSVFAIDKSQQNKISSQDGLVLVLDDSKFKKLEDCSDGVGLGGPGTTYTVTNNNSNEFSYNVIVIPSVKDKELLKQIRVSVDDVFIDDFSSLEESHGGYVIASNTLKSGYTKIHLFKYWYKLDTSKDLLDKDITFSYKVVKEK
jgi:hypothetical protein